MHFLLPAFLKQECVETWVCIEQNTPPQVTPNYKERSHHRRALLVFSSAKVSPLASRCTPLHPCALFQTYVVTMMLLSRRPEALMPGLPCCSCSLETLSWIPCTAPHLHFKVLPVFLLLGAELPRSLKRSSCFLLLRSLLDFAHVLLILQHVSSQAHWAFGRSLAFECASSSPRRPFLSGWLTTG